MIGQVRGTPIRRDFAFFCYHFMKEARQGKSIANRTYLPLEIGCGEILLLVDGGCHLWSVAFLLVGKSFLI